MTRIVKSSTTTETVLTRHFELNREDILTLLSSRKADNLIGDIEKGDEIEIFFQVPGGADWSSEQLDISSEHPIHVVITRRTKEVE